MIGQPMQNPPVERLYMRPVVGRRGRPAQPVGGSRKGAKAPRGSPAPPGGDYMVELTTFHIRPGWPRGMR